jgi:tRNA(Ile)-lysidine synthase
MGGETCQLVGRPRKLLKKLLQEEEVAPWLRERLPLLYMEDELVCIPGIGIAENYVAKANENGFLIYWEAPDFNLAGD